MGGAAMSIDKFIDAADSMRRDPKREHTVDMLAAAVEVRENTARHWLKIMCRKGWIETCGVRDSPRGIKPQQWRWRA